VRLFSRPGNDLSHRFPLIVEAEMERLLSTGGDEMPRDFLLRVMRDETQEISLRIAAAKAAAPYCHATLTSVDMRVSNSVEQMTEDELMRIAAGGAASSKPH